MKRLTVAVFFLAILGGLVWCRRAEAQDNTALQTANQNVQVSQNQLNHARQDYLRAVRTSGKDSPQAAAAKAKLDSAHKQWQDKMAERKRIRQHARGEMMQRHLAHRSAEHAK